MKIIKYQIQSLIYVKAEITKLVPLPINNVSDNYYLIIPTVISSLPDNVMFIQETMLIPPHSTMNYVPKLVKLGITLSQSIATKLTKGIDIRLIIIDNINTIASTSNIIKKNPQMRDININNNNSVVSDGTIIKVDQQRKELLGAIDDKITKNESMISNQISDENNNSLKMIVNENELPVEKQYSLNDNKNIINNINNNDEEENELLIEENNDDFESEDGLILDDDALPVKRGRGRPRKYPINEAQQQFQDLLLNSN